MAKQKQMLLIDRLTNNLEISFATSVFLRRFVSSFSPHLLSQENLVEVVTQAPQRN